MRRARARSTENQVSLFPFLAVLICTMGVLIVLLVLVVKNADTKSREVEELASEEVTQKVKSLQSETEMLQFQTAELETFRPNLVTELQNQKQRRAHLEDHSRQLRKELEALKSRWEQTQVAEETPGLSSRITELESQLDQLRKERDKELERVKNQKPQFAVVAYDGRQGTHRRPIYIECTPEGIDLRPYDIHLNLTEFTQPILAGNPLDAAILAIREFWRRTDPGQSNGAPYPLILVRPGGSQAYAVVREAMKSWDSEFGHQIIPGATDLVFPEANASLTEQLTRVIEDAKRRQRRLASSVNGLNQRLRGEAAGNGTSLLGSGGQAESGSQTPTGSATDDPLGSQGIPGGTGGESGVAPPTNFTGGGALSRIVADGQSTGDSPVLRATQRRGGFQGTSQSTGSPGASDPTNSRTTQSGSNTSNQQAGSGGPTSGTSRQAQAGASATSQTAGPGERSGSIGSPGQLGSQSASSNNMASADTPLSNQRGEGWALPSKTAGATAFRRPIPVTCYGDRLLVHPGSTPGLQDETFALDGNVTQAVDDMMNSIWDRIESWGVAGYNAYWKPELRVRVAAGGRDAFNRLRVLLQDSGLEVTEVR